MPETKYGIKQQAGKLTIYLYDDIEGDYYDWWNGKNIESPTSANSVKKALEENPNVAEIEIFINSFGGEVKEGLAIYNQLKRHAAYKTVWVDGFACSIASVIAMAGDKVIMGANTMMMVHHAMMGAFGNPTELRKAADDLEKIDEASNKSYKEKAGDMLSDKKLQELLDNESWLNAEECLTLGLCDEIKQKDPQKEAAQHLFEKVNQSKINQHKENVMQKMQALYFKSKNGGKE